MTDSCQRVKNLWNGRHLKNLKISGKYMTVHPSFTHIHLPIFYVCHFANPFAIVRKFGGIANVEILFHVMRFICLVNKLTSVIIIDIHFFVKGPALETRRVYITLSRRQTLCSATRQTLNEKLQTPFECVYLALLISWTEFTAIGHNIMQLLLLLVNSVLRDKVRLGLNEFHSTSKIHLLVYSCDLHNLCSIHRWPKYQHLLREK